ncbi:PP2C family protein-serine/threonine phosphatase [Cognatiyoonia sp. IB215182]|uniref:PP2C family protein-serine/threonine phosphatase n=1 Tax=Cognatiyoonia sp. IB215182 TaxID=3097353 RepID=UPI002A16DD10|nr:protein phosphatase 2C domain-containing protein [Cognatiyoonia sp. IB215182]MDX8352635.1 protein phosphatase 2C domain-containing protein [Cognatiyoonia sp. IB215182]
MWRSPEPRFDVASAICQGGRDYQEDAIVTDFPFGMDSGVVVLADGMGGHAAGDVASKIVVTEVYSELKFQSANFADFEAEIPQYLTSSAVNANNVVREYVMAHPETRGMGATLVSLVLIENRMFWMSIGDSPLYHYRAGKMQQLNEDHSMAPQIDFMVKQGLMDPETGKNHPDRNCLTSVILGDRVAKSDCPKTPFELQVGDIVVVSSDGLQYLEDERIQKILHRYRRRKSAEICGHLLEAIEALADPDQDNCSFSVIKLNHNKPVIRAIRAKPVDYVETPTATTTRVVELDDDDSIAAKLRKDAASMQKAATGQGQPAAQPQAAPKEAAPKPVIKEVKPVQKVDDIDAQDKTEEVDEATPPAKVAAGGK